MKKKTNTPLIGKQNERRATADHDPADSTNNRIEKDGKPLSRRDFIGRGAAVGALAAGFLAAPGWLSKSAVNLAQTSSDCFGCELVPYVDGKARADAALQIRIRAAEYERHMPIPRHPCNEDEKLYAGERYIGSYTKGIKRADGVDGNTFGEVDPVEYCKLLKALASGDPLKFEAIKLGFSNNCSETTFSEEDNNLGPSALEPNRQRRLDTPQAGLNFDLAGKDYYQLIVPSPYTGFIPIAFQPAFPFASQAEAVEIVENYWQALTRDVAFINYKSSALIDAAAADLSRDALLPHYRGPLDSSGKVTPQVYSRGVLPGDARGPFLSQLFLRHVPYGAQTINAQIRSPRTVIENDFMTAQAEWRQIQTGQTPNRKTAFGEMRFIRNGRDLAEYVHNDAIYQAYLNAALVLMTPQKAGGLGVPVNPYNPYNQRSTVISGYCKQLNFVEFGPSQLLSLLGEVSVRAHKAVWYQKWQVHRRLRPEEFGGRVHFKLSGERDYPIDGLINDSEVFDRTKEKYGTRFLSQAYPEGSPTHPAYGAGHATLAGACVTILKAWFDSERKFRDFGQILVPTADGLNVVDYAATDAAYHPSVADELNKLASNVSIGRNIAGVHWRSDYTESVFLGEQVAIQLLQDYGYTYNERFLGFEFRDFNGNLIQIGGNRS